MTTIYVPRVIESAEEAEALPAGTLIGSGGLSGSWITLIYPEDAEWDADDFPIHALVPVEAEGETEPAGGIDILHGGRHEWPARRRYVTQWEDA